MRIAWAETQTGNPTAIKKQAYADMLFSLAEFLFIISSADRSNP